MKGVGQQQTDESPVGFCAAYAPQRGGGEGWYWCEVESGWLGPKACALLFVLRFSVKCADETVVVVSTADEDGKRANHPPQAWRQFNFLAAMPAVCTCISIE